MPLDATESTAARTLALPFFNQITDSRIDEVCRALSEFLPKQAQTL
jgi:dTDP-4-amino-4,6-dideoxygalactose transaminase